MGRAMAGNLIKTIVNDENEDLSLIEWNQQSTTETTTASGTRSHHHNHHPILNARSKKRKNFSLW